MFQMSRPARPIASLLLNFALTAGVMGMKDRNDKKGKQTSRPSTTASKTTTSSTRPVTSKPNQTCRFKHTSGQPQKVVN